MKARLRREALRGRLSDRLGAASLVVVRAFLSDESRGRADSYLVGEKQAPGSRSALRKQCHASTAEHACYNPKDSELCLARAKPQETGVEVRSRCDVQIHGIS